MKQDHSLPTAFLRTIEVTLLIGLLSVVGMGVAHYVDMRDCHASPTTIGQNTLERFRSGRWETIYTAPGVDMTQVSPDEWARVVLGLSLPPGTPLRARFRPFISAVESNGQHVSCWQGDTAVTCQEPARPITSTVIETKP